MGQKSSVKTSINASKQSSLSAVKTLDFAQRTALYICALHKAETEPLLDNFAPTQRQRSQQFAQAVNGWDSATRQGRVTRELGTRSDGVERLKRLIVDAPPALRKAIGIALPAALKPHFPHIHTAETEIPRAMLALAQRLLKEALR
jgi:hypothetical protein